MTTNKQYSCLSLYPSRPGPLGSHSPAIPSVCMPSTGTATPWVWEHPHHGVAVWLPVSPGSEANAKSINHSKENQYYYNTYSGPPNWQRQNDRGTSALGDPEKGSEK
ncbi:hypothetical protein E2C01_015623 [Portunus trituberculatus]|uniref:Uncharacterized protein n=1 Tax=Portunus trituberculatus TaxID=210409 RepID=A0A5B7DN44_PORTR|nr:hypothetical protein [Portunus trituberculatus]